MSELVGDAGVRSLLALIPHADYVVIESARHMVAGDDNDAFNQAMEKFLTEHTRL